MSNWLGGSLNPRCFLHLSLQIQRQPDNFANVFFYLILIRRPLPSNKLNHQDYQVKTKLMELPHFFGDFYLKLIPHQPASDWDEGFVSSRLLRLRS